MYDLIEFEIIGNCSDLIMVALCKLCLFGGIESELDSLFIRYSTAFMSGGNHISGCIHTNLNDHTSLLVKGIRRLRQRTFDTSAGETP